MVRTSVALVAGMALTLVLAGSASATSALNLIWKNNGSTTIGTTSTAPAPTLTASVILQGDTVGIGGIFVTWVFDYLEADPVNSPGVFTADGNELNARSPFGFENSGPAARVGMNNQFAPISNGVTLQTESSGSAVGEIIGFDSSAGLQTGCISCTVTLGSVLFTTNTLSGDSNPDVVATVLPNGLDAIVTAFGGSAGGALTTDITFGSVNVLPEPMAGAFGIAALGALGLLARRRS